MRVWRRHFVMVRLKENGHRNSRLVMVFNITYFTFYLLPIPGGLKLFPRICLLLQLLIWFV